MDLSRIGEISTRVNVEYEQIGKLASGHAAANI